MYNIQYISISLYSMGHILGAILIPLWNSCWGFRLWRYFHRLLSILWNITENASSLSFLILISNISHFQLILLISMMFCSLYILIFGTLHSVSNEWILLVVRDLLEVRGQC